MARRWVLAGMMMAWGMGLTASAQQIPFGRDLVPTRTVLARLGLERHWMAVAPVSGTERLIEISIAGNLLFAQTNGANFSAFDAESGRMLWEAKLGSRTGDAQPASVNSFAVFVTSTNKLFALDRNTGRKLWEWTLESLPTSPTVCDEQRVIVGLNSGKLVAFNVKGKIGERKKIEVVLNEPSFAWNWQTQGAISTRPLLAGPAVAFGSDDGKAYVSRKDEPTMLFRFPTGGPVRGAFAGHGTRTLLIPSTDKNVYGIDLWSAEPKWIFSTGAPVEQEPLVTGDDAYIVNVEGMLSAMDPATGELRWTVSTHGGRMLAVSKARVYLESSDEDLFIVDRGSGRIVADPRTTHERAGLNLRPYGLGITNHLNDRLYFATASGMMVCLREIGQLGPRPLRDPTAKPFGYVPPEGIDLTPPGAKPVVVEPAAEDKKEEEKEEK